MTQPIALGQNQTFNRIDVFVDLLFCSFCLLLFHFFSLVLLYLSFFLKDLVILEFGVWGVIQPISLDLNKTFHWP